MVLLNQNQYTKYGSPFSYIKTIIELGREGAVKINFVRAHNDTQLTSLFLYDPDSEILKYVSACSQGWYSQKSSPQ